MYLEQKLGRNYSFYHFSRFPNFAMVNMMDKVGSGIAHEVTKYMVIAQLTPHVPARAGRLPGTPGKTECGL